jgi:molybdenum cofactor guanylyltransferase
LTVVTHVARALGSPKGNLISSIIMAEIAGAILAGGAARRMGGANKGALRIGGERIIDRQLRALLAVASPVFIVASDPEPYRDTGVTIVPDVISSAGPLGGIYTAIVASPHPRTLVLACDMPFITVALLTQLVGVENADLVIPRSARGYEPLCALYSKACGPTILARIERGDLQASTLPEGVRIAEIGPEKLAVIDRDGLLFANVNTPHDYARARSVHPGLFELKPDPTQDRITE